jgi:galactokinase
MWIWIGVGLGSFAALSLLIALAFARVLAALNCDMFELVEDPTDSRVIAEP